jgi:hypothetical protein
MWGRCTVTRTFGLSSACFTRRHHLNGCLTENLLPFRSLAGDPGSGLAGILTFAFVHIESAPNLFERFVQILIAGHKTPVTGSQMPLNGNLTLTSLKVRFGMFSLLPVYRLTSGLTVFAGFFKPEQFPTARIL